MPTADGLEYSNVRLVCYGAYADRDVQHIYKKSEHVYSMDFNAVSKVLILVETTRIILVYKYVLH